MYENVEVSHIFNMGIRWRSFSFKPGLLDIRRETSITLWLQGVAGHSGQLQNLLSLPEKLKLTAWSNIPLFSRYANQVIPTAQCIHIPIRNGT
jgi:hypothetical protein